MNKVRKGFVVLFVFICAVGFAKKFSDAPGGQGISTVGSGGDYASLAAAAADFNGYPGGCTGNWTLLILNSLTESSNVAFGNATNGYTVTIKPNTDVTATISFTDATDRTISGSLIIGATNVNNWASIVSTHNFVIDGSNAGTNSRNLTLENVNGDLANARVVRIVGNSDNVTIKNCIIKNRSVNSGPTFGVDFTSRNDGSNNYIPDNGTLDNCAIESKNSASAIGVQSGSSGTITSGNAQTGMTIKNCTITAQERGISLTQTSSATICDNTIKINQTSTGKNCFGFMHWSSNGAEGWTMNIYNNKFTQLQSPNSSANNGLTAIDVTGAPLSGTAPTYNIYNNMICGFNFTGASDNINQIYRGIRCGSKNCNVNIYYNSLYMPHFSKVSGASVSYVFGIGVTPTDFSGTANIKNNIVYLTQNGGCCIYKGNTTGLVSDYNDLYRTGANVHTGYYNGTNRTTLEDWKTATSGDANSYTVDPTIAHSPYTGKWVNPTGAKAEPDLHFDAPPGPVPGWATGTAISEITKDIDGDARGLINPMKGCDDGGSLPVTVEWAVVD